MGININNLNNTSMMKLCCQRNFFEIKFLPLIGILFFITLVFNYNEINGQVLTKSDTSNVHFLNSRKFFVYKVDKGETLFGIAQKFNISQEEILQFNHDIEKTGLKAKMKLWIPAYSWNKKDVVIEKEKEADKTENNLYNIVVVTSFGLPKIYTAEDTSDTYIDESLEKEVKDNLEFVEGILYSAELLKSEGLRVHLFIIDAESDSIKLLNKLKKNNGYNLIITNENGNILKFLSGFSMEREIKLFSCGINTIDLIKENKNAFSLNLSSGKQCEQMGKFSGKYFPNSLLITIKTNTSKENERSEIFRSGWLKSQSKPLIQIDYSKGGVKLLAESLDKSKSNVIFVSSSNEDMVSTILSAINIKIPEYNIKVIGLPTWQYFETIDQKLLANCNVYLFSSGFIEYGNKPVFNFRKFFRDKYYMEPSDISYQGYDAFLVAGKLLLMNGKKIFDGKSSTINGIFSDYTFVRSPTNNVYENENIHVYQPAFDISIDLAKKITEK